MSNAEQKKIDNENVINKQNAIEIETLIYGGEIKTIKVGSEYLKLKVLSPSYIQTIGDKFQEFIELLREKYGTLNFKAFNPDNTGDQMVVAGVIASSKVTNWIREIVCEATGKDLEFFEKLPISPKGYTQILKVILEMNGMEELTSFFGGKEKGTPITETKRKRREK